MSSRDAWIVLHRDITGSVQVRSEPAVQVALVLDGSDGRVLGSTVGPDRTATLVNAMRQALEAPLVGDPGPPRVIACHPDLELDVAREAKTLGLLRQVRLVVDESLTEAENVLDSMVAYMSGRRTAVEFPSAGDWARLYEMCLRFLDRRPWERMADDVQLAIDVEAPGFQRTVAAVLLGKAGITEGLALYPGDGPALRQPRPAGEMPRGTALLSLERQAPADLRARAARYGWPSSAERVPAFIAFDDEGAREIDEEEAQALTLAIACVLDAGELGPRLAEPLEGTVDLRDGPGRYRLGGVTPVDLGDDLEIVAERSMEQRLADLNVPKAVRPRAAAVLEIIDGACRRALDAEYAAVCEDVVGRLARKRPSPLQRGSLAGWAGGVLHAVGAANYLFDPSEVPHLTAGELSELVGVGKATPATKARQIRRMLGLELYDRDLWRPSLVGRSLEPWLVVIEGVVVDARTLPPALREELHRQGMIPDPRLLND